ncbi:hypothetical protein FKQ61_33900 [Vibrio sp. A14(2019)]|nr:hypothetical protein [Vibrio sp. A14(2019)]
MLWKNSANKAFKSDSKRLPVSLRSSMANVCHTLTRRYATQVNLGVQSFGISPAIRFVLSANELFYPQILG